MICYKYIGHPPIQVWRVYPRRGLNGLSILIPKNPIEKIKRVQYLTLSSGSLGHFSKSRGAYVKSLAIEYKCDYCLKMVTGNDRFRTLVPPLSILWPRAVIVSLNNFFCALTI